MRIPSPCSAALLACAAIAAIAPAAHASEVRSAEVQSSALGRALTYNVYLPTGYDAQSRLRYPVMYLLHGNDGQRKYNPDVPRWDF